ncbi:hypothetical protein BpHYR1_046865 [Brachionus plicatilis]|uniref:Uncharacterized protein n=1 Tax=Brachionus plicatilis TaxID=10195 RepID=A0A3M7RFY9_BRAPC|nr:hypothetical protein BpHYR1_046865 [Brachionus plicatilis]
MINVKLFSIKPSNKNRDKKMEIGQTARPNNKKSQNLLKIYQNLQKFGHFLAKFKQQNGNSAFQKFGRQHFCTL